METLYERMIESQVSETETQNLVCPRAESTDFADRKAIRRLGTAV